MFINNSETISPTHTLKHIGHENSLPKKLGLWVCQKERHFSKILPKTSIFVAE
jgi:hypothetical protein